MWTITCTPPLSERAVKEVTYRNAHICQDPPLFLWPLLLRGLQRGLSSCDLHTWIYLGWTHLEPSAQNLSTGAEQSPGGPNKQRNLDGDHKCHRGPHGDKVGRGLSSSWPRVTKSCTGMAFYLCYFIAQNEGIVPPFGRQRCQILQSQRDKRGHQLAVSLGTQGRLVGGQCCARLRLGG